MVARRNGEHLVDLSVADPSDVGRFSVMSCQVTKLRATGERLVSS